MISIAICDDQKVLLDQITAEIKNHFSLNNCNCYIDTYTKGTELRKQIFSGQIYDVIFLDINMPDINGLQLGSHLRQNGTRSLIVFLSSHDEYVFDSFKIQPFRYIRKKEFPQAVSQLTKDIIQELTLQKTKTKHNDIILNVNKSYFSIDPVKTIYAEYKNRTLVIVTEQDTINVKYKISDLENLLKEYGFIRIHKSFLVNYRYIYCIEHGEAVLDTGSRLPVSKHRVSEVKKSFKELMTC